MKQPILLKGYLALFCILLFLLPFSDVATSLPNVILILLIILFPFCVKKETIKEFQNQTVYLYLILVVYSTLNLWISKNMVSELSQLGKLYLPVGLFILSVPIKKYSKELKASLMIGVFCGICISLLSIALFILEQGTFNFSSGKQINEVLILERVYIAFLCVLSFLFSLDLLKLYKKLMLVNISIIVLFVLLIAARMALISIILIALIYIFKILDKKKAVLILGLGTFMLFGFFMINKNLQNRFFYQDQNNSFIKNLSVWEPRMVIWPCVSDIIQTENYSLFNGLGSYDLGRKKLIDCYEYSINHPEKKKWFLFARYNTHNQFLDFLLISGFIGFLLFCAVFLIFLMKNRFSFFSISLILSFVLFGLVENYLHRQVGVYCFGVFLIFLLSNDQITRYNRLSYE